MLSLEPMNILFTVINVLILFVIVRFALLKPIRKIIAERKKLIEDTKAEAEKSKEEAAKLVQDKEAELAKVDEEKKVIISQAKSKAILDGEKIVADANAKAEEIKKKAEFSGKETHDRMIAQVSREITELATKAAEEVASKNTLKSSQNAVKTVYDEFVENAAEDKAKTQEKSEKSDEKEEPNAELIYVEKPDAVHLAALSNIVAEKTGLKNVRFKLTEDKSIGDGFIIRTAEHEFDWSKSGRLASLKKKIEDEIAKLTKEARINGKLFESGQVISMIKENINGFTEGAFLSTDPAEIGYVKTVGDDIALVKGLRHAEYGEIVIFENGVKGMVQDVKSDGTVGIIILGDDEKIYEESKVVRTYKMAGVPVGNGFIGRVVNALGEKVDDGEEIIADGYRAVEQPAPGIIDRKSVSVPMETGILSIDSMFPVGRGQRELIIGDRQTGKTAIAIDTILNQKDKDVICIYCAIGQKSSTVGQVVRTLKKYGAMDYSIVVNSPASDPAPLQYIAPYSATTIAEYFMYAGKDVLIIYDDLSKHAVAYRTISLLLKRSPGREAYPGDVFYLHSRLLERSSRLSDELGGGSITALPIIETQAGDVSAYIPTNVISITDGQIYLESDLFNSGMRPAVNVGLSVSRVGGAAQTKAMKKAAGSVRIDLAQYREMQVFTQFSSDMDDATMNQLKYGADLMELLKQPQYHALSLTDQVVLLVVATNRLLMNVPTDEISSFKDKLLSKFRSEYSDICEEIIVDKDISEDLKDRIIKAAAKYVDECYPPEKVINSEI